MVRRAEPRAARSVGLPGRRHLQPTAPLIPPLAAGAENPRRGLRPALRCPETALVCTPITCRRLSPADPSPADERRGNRGSPTDRTRAPQAPDCLCNRPSLSAANSYRTVPYGAAPHTAGLFVFSFAVIPVPGRPHLGRRFPVSTAAGAALTRARRRARRARDFRAPLPPLADSARRLRPGIPPRLSAPAFLGLGRVRGGRQTRRAVADPPSRSCA